MRARRATAEDVDALVDFPHCPGVLNLPRGQVREDFVAGRLRPEWSWVLEDEGRLLGRALWWGRGHSAPSALDALDVLPEVDDPRSAAVELLRGARADFAVQGEAPLPPYTVQLPRDWRDDAQSTRPATWRREAADAVGMTRSLERCQYAWTSESGVPASSTRVAISGAERITATADVDNRPMAAAFDRAAYQVTEIRLVLDAPN